MLTNNVHFCFLFCVTVSVCNVESMLSGDWLIGKVFEGGCHVIALGLVWRDWEKPQKTLVRATSVPVEM
jgi:hypothetical protein